MDPIVVTVHAWVNGKIEVCRVPVDDITGVQVDNGMSYAGRVLTAGCTYAIPVGYAADVEAARAAFKTHIGR